MRTGRAMSLGRLALGLAVSASVGCGEPSTQVLAYISADEASRALATSLRVRVCEASEAPACRGGYEETRDLESRPSPLPARIPIGPPSSTTQRFWLEASLLDAGGESLATLRAEGGFAAGERRAVYLEFTEDCAGTVCGPRQTCLAGRCVAACLEPTRDMGPDQPPTPPGACGGSGDAGAPDPAAPDAGPDLGASCDCPCATDLCVGGECVPPSGVSRLALGDQHTCVATDSSILCFGENTWGQLGLGPERIGANTDRPERVALEGTVVDLSAGDRNTCAVFADGALYCWGDDADARLGSAERGDREAPVRIGLELGPAVQFARVAIEYRHGCAVTTAARAYCWGRADRGQLGWREEPLPPSEPGPGRVPGAFDSVTVGNDFSCALGTTGGARCWGTNAVGEIAQPEPLPYAIAPDALPFRRWSQIDANHRRTCGIDAETGRAWCWGLNAGNRSGLADRSMGNAVRVPSPVAGEVALARLAVGQEHTCGIGRDGVLYCWGYNLDGQLGLGDTSSRAMPTAVGSDSDWARVDAGAFHTCATKADGRLFCWGRGLSAQLTESCGRDDVAEPCRVCLP